MSDSPDNCLIMVDDISQVVMKPRLPDIGGPIILWENGGYEGWSPHSFPTIRAALEYQRFHSEFVITRVAEFDVCERGKP